MDGLSLLHFSIWKLVDMFKDFVILYLFILLGEWFVQKKGYNLFERAWIITMIVLFVITFMLWVNFGRVLLFF